MAPTIAPPEVPVGRGRGASSSGAAYFVPMGKGNVAEDASPQDVPMGRGKGKGKAKKGGRVQTTLPAMTPGMHPDLQGDATTGTGDVAPADVTQKKGKGKGKSKKACIHTHTCYVSFRILEFYIVDVFLIIQSARHRISYIPTHRGNWRLDDWRQCWW